jgi:hypothetical protein
MRFTSDATERRFRATFNAAAAASDVRYAVCLAGLSIIGA